MLSRQLICWYEYMRGSSFLGELDNAKLARPSLADASIVSAGFPTTTKKIKCMSREK